MCILFDKRQTKLIIAASLLSVLISNIQMTNAESKENSEQDKNAQSTNRPSIDLAFCIDTTGSMQSEIDVVKSKTKEIVAKLSGTKPIPDIRIGLVAFRDKGDEYLTKVFQFSEDIDSVVKDINSLNANGGGDAPEAVAEALHSSVKDLRWSSSKKTLKLLFLIGDAGPKHYMDSPDWRKDCREAINQGIQINTIACQGLRNFSPSEGVGIFQQIAKLTDGKAENLTYKQEIVEANGTRSILLSSGDSLYRMDSSAAGAWREGVDELKAKSSTRAKSMLKPYATSPAPSLAAEATPVHSLGAARSVSIQRSESNLVDIVLKTAKEAASKKANIIYKD